MTRPLRAYIDLEALTHNFSLARKAAPGSRIMAVIKADAYGHGAVPVARALDRADAFAVASLEEALQLRGAGIRQALVLLDGVFHPGELDAVVAEQLQLVVHCEEQVQWLEQFRADAPLSLWLKVNTGMNRLGFGPDEAPVIWQRLQRLPCLNNGTLRLMSHFACADDVAHPANNKQLASFNAVDAALAGMQRGGVERSMANSAALLTRDDTHFDWVRPGIMLYGASPMLPNSRLDPGLRPVMRLESRLMAVYRRRRGDAVGYGLDWSCPEDMPLGIVAAGYGDGYPRHAPCGTPVRVNGVEVPLVARVSMDMICVDLRNQPNARPGDPVCLWGDGLPVERVAAQAGTISYELLCGVTARVPRVYSNELPVS